MTETAATAVPAEPVSYKGWRGIKKAFSEPSALTMLFLGFGSGLPFLLIASQTLSVRLRDDGIDLKSIGLISLASFFYLLKFVWAPMLDRYKFVAFGFLGRRRSWLLISQIVMLFALAALAFVKPVSDIPHLVMWVLIASFAGATMDTVVDAYRIEIAPESAQAALAATYTLGYRFGLILAGAGALYIAELGGWKTAYLIMAALMLIPIITTLVAKEPVDISVRRQINIGQAFVEPIAGFFKTNGVLVACALLIFVGLYKFPDQVIGVMAGPFYLDSGFTKADIATVSKLFGVWVGIAGAFLGGVAVAAFGFRKMLLVAAIGVALSNIAFVLMAMFPGQIWSFYAAILADNLFQGFAGVVFIAFASSLTDRNFTATQFALLVSLANLPGKFVGGVSGYIVENTSYKAFFIMSALTVIPALLLLAWLWKRIHDPVNDTVSAP